MATAVFSFKVDPDGKVTVLHVFFGASKHAADAELRQHAEACPKFGPAYRADQTIEYSRTIDDLPPADGDALEEWLDELLTGLGTLEGEEEDEPIEVEPE